MVNIFNMRIVNSVWLLFITVIISSNSCSRDDLLIYPPLKLERIPYSGNELRIDGYYYQELEPENTEGNGNSFFLYKNGVILYGGGFNINRQIESENNFKDPIWINGIKDQLLTWGVFQIDGDSIQIEKWYPSSGGPLPTYVIAGKILNNTRFHITEIFELLNGEKVEVGVANDYYQFVPFSPKPDSTNNFIK